jgi:osmotically inducible lipoprotein OsmB
MKVHTMSRSIAATLILAGLGLALGGCGYSTGDRAVSGGLIGAGAGAAVGAVTGGSPLTGALIGGGIGAVGGAVTSHNDIDLGRPIWR